MASANVGNVHFFGEIDTTFETGFRLAEEGRLCDWDSVVARSQKAGRGQLGRHWDSPPGNLYASIRLPQAWPFTLAGAAVAVSAYISAILANLGCPVMIKWPNDLVITRGKGPAKVGGILLQEKGGCLLAGIGINLGSAPDALREEAELPAAKLDCPACSSPAMVWLALARGLHGMYMDRRDSWRGLADQALLWRGREVMVSDGQESLTGILTGIGENGGALLEQGGSIREILGASLRVCS